MSDADTHLAVLREHAPVVARCLSPMGRRIVFPKGIPFQAAQAGKTRLKATVGQVTDGAGGPMPLPSMAADLGALDPSCLLYAPQSGSTELRTAWLNRQRGLAGDTTSLATLPYVTHGLTHGIGLVADLFVDADTTVVLPSPHWENYDLLFTIRDAGSADRITTFPFFGDDGSFNLAGLGDVLDRLTGKAVLVLNFPANPTGWSPTPAQADAIVQRLLAHKLPLVVVSDDAYQGVVHEDGLLDHSIFWRLSARADLSRLLPVKVDGATKEMLFFSSRVGFLTFGVGPEAAEVLENKLNALVRGTVGGPPGPSLALLQRALERESTPAEFAQILSVLTHRYGVLKEALQAESDVLTALPFNSAYFALIGLPEHLDVHEVRLRLIHEHSVGTIAVPEVHALRIAYCSTTPEALREVVKAVAAVVRG